MLLVRRLVGHSLGKDDLVFLVHHCLAVVALKEAPTPFHDSAVRIGEVALRLGLDRVTDGSDVERPDYVEEPIHRMILLQPISHGRRKQVRLIRIPWTVLL